MKIEFGSDSVRSARTSPLPLETSCGTRMLANVFAPLRFTKARSAVAFSRFGRMKVWRPEPLFLRAKQEEVSAGFLSREVGCEIERAKVLCSPEPPDRPL